MTKNKSEKKRRPAEDWEKLLWDTPDGKRKLKAVERQLGDWELVARGEGSTIAGTAAWRLSYYAAKTTDGSAWALKVVSRMEPDDDDEDSEAETNVDVVAAIKAPAGVDESLLVQELIAAYEASDAGFPMESIDDVGRFELAD